VHWSYRIPEGGNAFNSFKNLRDCSVVVAVADADADADADAGVVVFVSPMAGICWGLRFSGYAPLSVCLLGTQCHSQLCSPISEYGNGNGNGNGN